MEKIIVFGKGAYWEYKKETIKQQYEVEVILDKVCFMRGLWLLIQLI